MITLNIPTAIDEVKKKKITLYPCHANRASSAGQECVRRLVYDRVEWDKKILHDVGLQYIFDEGNRSEETTMKELNEAGVQVFEGQRAFKYPENGGETIVTGRIDCTVTQEAIPLEAKSINPYDFGTISDYESVKKHKKAHIRGYLAQLMVYLFLKEKPEGILLFRDKSSGRYKQINVPLDYQLVEETLKKFELVNKHIRENTLPERIADLTICKTCPFRALCLPDTNFGDGVKLVSDNYLEQLIEKRQAVEISASEYDGFDKELKELIKKRAENKEAHFVINGRWEAVVKTHGKSLRVDILRLGEIAVEA